jgi:topoisomerase IV subunit B
LETGVETGSVSEPRTNWRNTTHDWTREVDVEHLERIRRERAVFAPSGVLHLVLEVLAYPADEAAAVGRSGRCVVALHGDGSISVTDDGRGTDTRTDDQGRMVKKPVMATKDLRFFDHPDVETLSDGCPRRGMSVVAALSTWLAHTNRRLNGSWTQRYEHGIPVTDLVPVDGDGTTGTTVHFLPDATLLPETRISFDELQNLTASLSPRLSVRHKRLFDA